MSSDDVFQADTANWALKNSFQAVERSVVEQEQEPGCFTG